MREIESLLDTITDIELGEDGKVVAVKGKCKAKDLRKSERRG